MQHVTPTHELEVDGGMKLHLFCHLCVVRVYICVYSTKTGIPLRHSSKP